MNAQDARLTAFCSSSCPELFHAIVHRHEIFRHDPLDVPSVHEEARQAFASLLNKVGAGLPYGKILLLLGEAGSGKTHLMRAFRSEVTSTASGYFAYMQMTSSETNYAQYVLTNVIDSLHQPYDEAVSEISGLMRLSNGLVEDPDLFDPLELEYLRYGELDLPRVFDCSDHLIGTLGLQNLNPDLLRVLLLLQRSEPYLKNLVLQYLRCHDLSPHDQQKLGGIRPLRDASGPREVIKSLAGLAWALEKTPFVLCLDQLEDIYELNAPTQGRFLAAMRVVREVADAVPSLIVVIACLEDFYQKLKTSLTSPLLDRIEKDPEPVNLSNLRSAAEVEQLIIRRLQFLFAECEAPFSDELPLFPFAADVPQKLAAFRARAVLELCRQARERSLVSGQRPEIQDGQESLVPPIVDPTVPLEQLWNDFYTAFKPAPPESETAMTKLLAGALEECVRELPDGCTVTASANEKQVYAETKAHGEVQSRLLVTICNEKPQGGSLGHAVDAARERAQNQNRRCIIARSTVFPDNPRTQIAKKLGELIAEGGRRTVIEDSDWRAMQAMQTFVTQHGADSQFAAWLRVEKPLTKLKPVSLILDLDTLTTVACAHLHPAPPVIETLPKKTAAPSATAKADKPVVQTNGIGLGDTREIAKTPVTINPSELTRHAAFLGGSGSGKTTLALHLIENLILAGVPAVLIDRKGDLCSYASDVAWNQPLSSPELEARRAELRDTIDIALYTPGREDGRPLCLPVIPEGLAEMKPSERELAAKHTAGALAGMMGYKANGNDLAKTAVLQKALIVLAQIHPAMNLDDLLRIVHDEDPSLLNAVGYLDTKHFKKLVQDLETLRLGNADLVQVRGEKLSAESLFHAPAGKTRLTIISTKFFDSPVKLLFWISQFLQEMNRYAGRHPSDQLQAVLLFDEADLYLPATSKPSTKEPMENALKRFRSAGLGLLLATQSPGDFDYKAKDNIRNWFVGRVKEPTALAKMKPMLSEARTDVASKLPAQGPGQFFVIRDGEVTSLQGTLSLISPKQLPDDEILALAKLGRSPGR